MECASPAPAIQINREEVRMLVADLGYAETSKRTGIKEPTLRQWSKRGKWNVQRQHSQAVTTVTQRPSDAHAQAIAELETQTRMALARSAANLATQSEKAKLRDSGNVKNVAQTAAIVHRWDAKTENTGNVIVNVALLGIAPSEVAPTTIDVDPVG